MEHLIKIKLGSEEAEFLVDAGATYSVLNTLERELRNRNISFIGTTGIRETRPFFKPLKFKLGKQWVTHQFLYLPKVFVFSKTVARERFTR